MLLQVLLRHLLCFCIVGDILVLATIWSCVNFFILVKKKVDKLSNYGRQN